MWIGYHLSPMYSFLTGEIWDSFLLVRTHIDQGLLFSSLCMFAYLYGFGLVSKRTDKRLLTNVRSKFIMPRVRDEVLIGIAVVSFLMFFIEVGGFDEMWRSSHHRGDGQFLQRDFWGKIARINSVLSTPVHTALACIASLYILQSRRKIIRLAAGWFSLLVASFSSISFFSRGAGFSFILFSFIALRAKGKKALPVAIVSVCFAVYLGSVGLNARGGNYPGLGNFLDAVFAESDSEKEESAIFIPDSMRNSLEAMAPWTRKAEAAELEGATVTVMGPRFIWNLNPLPSEFVPLAPLGQGLAKIMGTYGSVGLTTPAFAELYYAFGLFGFLFMIPMGAVYSWFERLTSLKPGAVSSICFIICFISFPLGLHSTMRAMTRPLLYAFVFIIASKYVARFIQAERLRKNRISSTRRRLTGRERRTSEIKQLKIVSK
jgi:hypothetical protein